MLTFVAILMIVIVLGAVVGCLIAFLPSAALTNLEKSAKEMQEPDDADPSTDPQKAG